MWWEIVDPMHGDPMWGRNGWVGDRRSMQCGTKESEYVSQLCGAGSVVIEVHVPLRIV